MKSVCVTSRCNLPAVAAPRLAPAAAPSGPPTAKPPTPPRIAPVTVNRPESTPRAAFLPPKSRANA